MEQKAAHTPGPWKFGKELTARSGEWLVSFDAGSKGRGIAIAETRAGSGNEEANARLIAAAPELLAALERAYMALIGYLPAHRNDVTDAAIGAAHAAITKATGRAA